MKRKLTPEEEQVMIHKGTEPRFCGKYNDFFEKGTYHCKQCGVPLYASSSKFDSGCGWPSFDDELADAIKRQPDKDGDRTEIVCSSCGGHLGHVFEGEGFTSKNVRHCVNSISLFFVPGSTEIFQCGESTLIEPDLRYDTAIFAGGCFWGIQDEFQKIPGVISATSGYTGGTLANPSYQQVCITDTGHAEAVMVTFDRSKVSYRDLLDRFFAMHDPTQVNRQGVDEGEQYRTEIFYTTPEQEKLAKEKIEELKEKGVKVATKVTYAAPFYKAEEYHQDYFQKNPRIK